jgi:2-dehydro-3-deoxy-D-arabinonate dehydratase
LIPEKPLDRAKTKIEVSIVRGDRTVFRDDTNLGQLKREFEELIGWLGKENEFPHGAILLTGTGIVPPDEFALQDGDIVTMEVTGIGRLTNPVVQASAIV